MIDSSPFLFHIFIPSPSPSSSPHRNLLTLAIMSPTLIIEAGRSEATNTSTNTVSPFTLSGRKAAILAGCLILFMLSLLGGLFVWELRHRKLKRELRLQGLQRRTPVSPKSFNSLEKVSISKPMPLHSRTPTLCAPRPAPPLPRSPSLTTVSTYTAQPGTPTEERDLKFGMTRPAWGDAEQDVED